jgi:hypothetical protein
MLIYARPDGLKFVGYVDEATALTSETTTDAGLTVTNTDTGKTAALPNTPPVVAPVL